MDSDDSYRINRRLLQSSLNTEVTIPFQLSNGEKRPEISKGDVVMMLPDEDIEAPVDVLARVLEVREHEIVADAVEYLSYRNVRGGVAEIEAMTGMRKMSPFRARKILVGGEVYDNLLHNPSTVSYVALMR
jgi:hypothetical protein